jgi:hypothetical protein
MVRRPFSAVWPVTVVAAVLSVGAAGAPGRSGHPVRHHSPRLLAKPGRLAPALLLAPGDRVARLIDLRKRGRGSFAAIYFVARPRDGSPLSADPANGLRVELRTCPKRWRRHGASYQCSAKTTTVLSERRLVGRTRLKRLGLGKRPAHVELVLSLPPGAGNELQGQATSMTYSFIAVTGRRGR